MDVTEESLYQGNCRQRSRATVLGIFPICGSESYAEAFGYGSGPGVCGTRRRQKAARGTVEFRTTANQDRGLELLPGMTLAIEPMINLSGRGSQGSAKTDWTVVTRSGSLSAHFEHTIAITDDGPKILTYRKGEDAMIEDRVHGVKSIAGQDQDRVFMW